MTRAPAATRRIHLDPLGGVAGDMFVAALTEAFPDLRAPLLACLAGLAMPVPVVARFVAHRDGAFAGTRFAVEADDAAARDRRASHREHAHDHTEPHDDGYHRHDHVSHAWIARWLADADVAPTVRDHALAIFRALAGAEAAVHGVAVDAVEFHEVGSWDSITDIVAAAFLIAAVGPAAWTCGPLPLGGGTVQTAHGVLPVPAPATMQLLLGLPVIDDGIAGERVTPTGAAIVRHLCGPAAADAHQPMRIIATGSGFGNRSLPGRPNLLRCTVFAADTPNDHDSVDAIAFEIDDQSPEDLAVGLDRLRAHADVLQVYQTPTFGKKGRMASRIEVLARAGCADVVADACFTETTTIGLRLQRLERRVLMRTAVETSPRVKLVARPDATPTAKAEMDDLAHIEGGHDARERARRGAERQALEDHAGRRNDGR